MAVQFKDISEYFKSGLSFQDLYKLSNFGNTMQPQNTTQRAQALTTRRRETRGDALLKRRKISMSKMSPYVTPNKKQGEEKPANEPAIDKAVEDRRAKLERWQQMKRAKQQAEKERKKPPFKVGVASAVNGVSNGNSRLDSTRLANFSRIGPVEPVNKLNVRETKTVRLRNAKKEETMKETKSSFVAPRGSKRTAKINSTSSESSLASEKSQMYTYRTRSQTNALETRSTKEVKGEVKSVSSSGAREKKTIKQTTPKKTNSRKKNPTNPSSSEEELGNVPETTVKKNLNRTRKAGKPLSSTEEDQGIVAIEVPAKKKNNQANSIKSSSSNGDVVMAETTPTKKPPSKTKTPSKPSSSEEELVGASESTAKKTPSRTKKAGKPLSSIENQTIVASAKEKNRKAKSTKSSSNGDVIMAKATPTKKTPSPTKNSAQPSSSNEDNFEPVVTKTPTKKKSKSKTPMNPPASSEENLEVAVAKTFVKESGNRSKTSIKFSPSLNEGVAVSETFVEKNHKSQDERTVLSDITPEKNIPAIYISPFVTIARGKNSARKEYQKRRSLNDSQHIQLEKDIEAYTSPTAGAAYFRSILDETINRLQGMCREWEAYKEMNSPPEEACDMINVAIGQTQLLINKKFQQFRGLISRCEAKIPEAPVTCEDLHGFWDVIFMQVVNIDKRFDHLKNLKENNWVEIIPEKKVVVKKVQPVVKKTTAKSTSNLKEIIQAARRLKKNQETNRFDGGFFSVSSPAKNTEETKNTPRKSIRNRRSSVGVNSPGLKVLRASTSIKQIAEGKTPSRSILKSSSCLTSEKKTVLFQDALSESDVENDAAVDLNKTPRRSQRFSRCASKLF